MTMTQEGKTHAKQDPPPELGRQRQNLRLMKQLELAGQSSEKEAASQRNHLQKFVWRNSVCVI